MRETVIEAVAALSVPEIARLLGASAPLVERAATAVQQLAAGTAMGLPAWRRYTGVVWTHLDPSGLSAAKRRCVVIPSGLLGIVTGEDPVPDYRLGMSVTVGSVGRLDRWWRGAVTDALAGWGRGPIIDLLPAEHARAIDWELLGTQRPVIRVTFIKAGQAGQAGDAARDAGAARRAAGHDAKAAKGVFARTLLEHGLAAAADFEWAGWRAHQPSRRSIVVVAPG